MPQFIDAIKNKKHTLKRLTIVTLSFWLPVLVFSRIAKEYITRDAFAFDAAFLHWIHTFNTPMLDTLFLCFTFLGNAIFVVPAALIVCAYLIYKKLHMQLLLFIFGVGSAALANLVLKLIFQRDRPALWYPAITETTYSFPSGHAMVSCAFILCLLVMLWPSRWRLVSLVIGPILIVIIGLSRLYLGVHYPTDVLTGWAVSSIWIAAVTTHLSTKKA